MKYRFLFLICLIPFLFTGACTEPATPAIKPLDFTDAKSVADAIASDLVQDDAADLFKHLDVGFQTMVKNEKEVKKVLGRMYAESGPPLECVYKISQSGIRKDGVWERPSRTFWYSVRTKKYQKGKYFLKVEIVPAFNGHPLDTSGFGILSFKDKVPDYLQ